VCGINKLQFYSVGIQQQHTIISIPVWLHVSIFSRPSSDQHFPVDGKIGAHYTLDPSLTSPGIWTVGSPARKSHT